MPSALLPIIGKVAAPLLGSLFGAIGGSGKQSGSEATQNTTQNSTTTAHSDQSATSNATQQQGEDPLTALFRVGLLGNIGGEIDNAKQPIFGDAAKASFVNNLNDLSDHSFQSLTGNLARRGVTNSGALTQGAGDIEQSRFGNLASFYSQLPFQEAQARSARVNPLLNTAAGLLGQGPRSLVSSGEQTGTTNTTTDTKGTSTGTATKTDTGPSFLSGLFGNLSGAIGDNSAGISGWLNNLWNKGKS